MVESIIENGVLSLDEAPIALPSFKFFTVTDKGKEFFMRKNEFLCC